MVSPSSDCHNFHPCFLHKWCFLATNVLPSLLQGQHILGNMLQTSGWDKNLNGVLSVLVPLVHLFNSPFALNFTKWSSWPFGIICVPISVSILILSSALPRSLIYQWFWAPNYRNHPLAETPVLDLDPETSFPTSNALSISPYPSSYLFYGHGLRLFCQM